MQTVESAGSFLLLEILELRKNELRKFLLVFASWAVVYYNQSFLPLQSFLSLDQSFSI